MRKIYWFLLALIAEIIIGIFVVNSSRYYKNYMYSLLVQRRHVTLVVGVISAPVLADRRHAIRNTWLKFCKNQQVVCKFFVDSYQDMDKKTQTAMEKEQAMYNDIEYMSVPPGVNFGRRILYILEWSQRNFVFDFVLRVDDDIFVCLQRLLYELPHRNEAKLYWGHVHCIKNRVRVDEEFLLMSHDLVHVILQQKDSLLCNPFGDISVALWIRNITGVTYVHDPRVFHDAKPGDRRLFEDASLCHHYLAINSAYKTETFRYWINVQHEDTKRFDILSVKPFDQVCNQSKTLDWRDFARGHRFEPVRCVRKPTWSFLGHIYLGRKGEEEKKKMLEMKIRKEREMRMIRGHK